MKIIRNLVLIALFSNSVFAADEQGQFAVRTLGMKKCTEFVAAKNSKNTETYSAFLGWMDGYLTSINQNTKETFDIVPWGNSHYLATMMESFCKKYPEERFYIATNKLAGTFYPNRVYKYSKLLEFTEGDRKVFIYEKSLIRLKDKLKEKQLYQGKSDAKFDKALRETIGKYQKDNHLPVTFLPDPLLLHHLFYQSKQ